MKHLLMVLVIVAVAVSAAFVGFLAGRANKPAGSEAATKEEAKGETNDPHRWARMTAQMDAGACFGIKRGTARTTRPHPYTSAMRTVAPVWEPAPRRARGLASGLTGVEGNRLETPVW